MLAFTNLLKRLMLQKLEDGGDVKEHIALFFDAVDKLESMLISINGDLLAIMLFYSLPSSYENFRCAIESRDGLPSADALKVKIIEESEARKQNSSDVVAAMNVVRKNSGHKRDSKSKRYRERPFRCYKCGVIGHKADICPKKLSTQNFKYSVNTVDESFVATYSAAAPANKFSSHSKFPEKTWLLNSGCTAHLCNDKNKFLSLDGCTKSKLNLASDA